MSSPTTRSALGKMGQLINPEQLTSLRSIPNLNVFRPSDLIETFECWQLALKKDGPSVIALTRQKINPVRKEYNSQNLSSNGAYEILRTNDNIKVTILSSGSETNLACEISHKLPQKISIQKLFQCHVRNYLINKKRVIEQKY